MRSRPVGDTAGGAGRGHGGRYYYAPGVGLVLTTATGGTSISLVSAELV